MGNKFEILDEIDRTVERIIPGLFSHTSYSWPEMIGYISDTAKISIAKYGKKWRVGIIFQECPLKERLPEYEIIEDDLDDALKSMLIKVEIFQRASKIANDFSKERI